MDALWKRAALVVAIAGASTAAWADGDGGDNGMTPGYGDSWAALEGHTTAPVPSMQAQLERRDAEAAFAHARASLADSAQQLRSKARDVMHEASPHG